MFLQRPIWPELFFIHLFHVFITISLQILCQPFSFNMFNFDFMLRNREDLKKKSFTGRLLYDLIFPILLLVLILDDFPVVVLQFQALICQPCRGFQTPVASCIPHCISTFDVVEARKCSFLPFIHPQPLRALWGVGPVRIEVFLTMSQPTVGQTQTEVVKDRQDTYPVQVILSAMGLS